MKTQTKKMEETKYIDISDKNFLNNQNYVISNGIDKRFKLELNHLIKTDFYININKKKNFFTYPIIIGFISILIISFISSLDLVGVNPFFFIIIINRMFLLFSYSIFISFIYIKEKIIVTILSRRKNFAIYFVNPYTFFVINNKITKRFVLLIGLIVLVLSWIFLYISFSHNFPDFFKILSFIIFLSSIVFLISVA